MIYKECIKIWRSGLNEDLINKFWVRFTYSSNKTENNETRLRDVEAVFRGERAVGLTGRNKTIKEIENHRYLCNDIFKLSKQNNSKLSIDLIKHFNHALMKDCFTEELLIKGERPGEFRRGIVELHDVGVAPIEIVGKLNSLIDEINNVQISGDNALNVVSYFICYFESTYPFADGNGRVARMLLNYLLIGNNLPPIIIFYNDIEQYYLALECFNKKQEIDKMVNFLENQAYKTWVKDYNFKLKRLKYFLD